MELSRLSRRAILAAYLSVLLVGGITVLGILLESHNLPDVISYNGQTYLRSEYPSDTSGLDLERIAYADRGTFVGSLRAGAVEIEAPSANEPGSIHDVFEFDADNALLVGTENHNRVYVKAGISNT